MERSIWPASRERTWRSTDRADLALDGAAGPDLDGSSGPWDYPKGGKVEHIYQWRGARMQDTDKAKRAGLRILAESEASERVIIEKQEIIGGARDNRGDESIGNGRIV